MSNVTGCRQNEQHLKANYKSLTQQMSKVKSNF
jgi:hypothetical protein